MLIISCNMSVSSLMVCVQNHQKRVQKKKKKNVPLECLVLLENDVQTLSTLCAGRPNVVCLYRIVCV